MAQSSDTSKINLLLLIGLLILASCASRPILYPNQKFNAVGEEAAKKDVDQCMEASETYLKKYRAAGGRIAKGAGRGAILGTVMGGVSGLLFGNASKAIAAGAAMGAAGGATGAALSPDQIKQAYVNQCLQDKGYRVMGWD
ncbi:MAG: hypothetical protein J6Y94_02865 [Bacteriovoracaceae bacterium]|nr:hypothetical protein [Bacteriovoracaceae bacterium]